MDDHRYDDIIDLPRPVSPTRRRMTPLERAAQFSPFAALTGYDAALAESVRLTEEKAELDEDALRELEEKLRLLASRTDHPLVTVTYFRPDTRKKGGAYATVTGKLKKLRLFERELLLEDGTAIPLDDVAGLSGPCFSQGNESP